MPALRIILNGLLHVADAGVACCIGRKMQLPIFIPKADFQFGIFADLAIGFPQRVLRGRILLSEYGFAAGYEDTGDFKGGILHLIFVKNLPALPDSQMKRSGDRQFRARMIPVYGSRLFAGTGCGDRNAQGAFISERQGSANSQFMQYLTFF